MSLDPGSSVRMSGITSSLHILNNDVEFNVTAVVSKSYSSFMFCSELPKTATVTPFSDCQAILDAGYTKSGLYTVRITSADTGATTKVDVYCHMENNEGFIVSLAVFFLFFLNFFKFFNNTFSRCMVCV